MKDGQHLWSWEGRVFGGRVSGTAIKGTLIGILYAVALALVLLAVTYPVFVGVTRGEP